MQFTAKAKRIGDHHIVACPDIRITGNGVSALVTASGNQAIGHRDDAVRVTTAG